ncbi:alpha/beta hydrolase family protein [Mycobacterium sp. NPDC003449]
MTFTFSTDESFSYETLRAIAYTPYDGADFGEVAAAVQRVTAGDLESWYDEWYGLAQRTEAIAEQAARGGHGESARCAYLRAANYYRTAEFYLRDDPRNDPRVLATWERGVRCFRDALALSAFRSRRVGIPYAGIELEGYFIAGGEGDEPRPTLLAHGGFDSTVEEMYFTAAAAAVRRGWNCLIFEGPGQGAALRREGLPFRGDWEAVVTPTVDYALALPEVDPSQVALLGMSMGGFLAPRAAAFEHRLAACVAFDGIYDFGAALRQVASSAGDGSPDDLDSLLSRRHELPTNLKWLLSNAVWTFGTDRGDELRSMTSGYTMAGIADRITCPTLVCDGEEDEFATTGQAQQLYDALTCDKELIVFTAAEGAQSHCQMGALTLFHQRAFDWLDDVVRPQKQRDEVSGRPARAPA